MLYATFVFERNKTMKRITSIFLCVVIILTSLGLMSVSAATVVTATEDPSTRITGDVNNDGVVDPTDVAYLRRYLARWDGYVINEENADINGDGEVDPTDVAFLRRHLARWEEYLVLREQEPEPPEVLYSVTDIKAIDASAVSVEISSETECYLDVVILKDVTGTSLDWATGGELANGKTYVESAIDKEFVEVSFENSIPEYFVVVAVLLDTDGRMLCEPYTFIEYTRAYEGYLAQTTHDFEAERVVNLDETADNNFLVLKNGIPQIQAGENGKNLLDNSEVANGKYIFSNTDTAISSLNAGDEFALLSEDGTQVYLIQVVSIANNNGIITINASSSPELLGFVDYIKIDTEIELEEGAVDMSEADEGVVWLEDPSDPEYTFDIEDYYEGRQTLAEFDAADEEFVSHGAMISPFADIDVGGSVKKDISYGIRFEKGFFRATGKVTGAVKASVRVVYDIIIFGADYFEIKITTSIELEAQLKAEIFRDNDENSSTITLGTIYFPTPIVGVGIEAKLTAPIRWEASAGVVAKATAKVEVGFKYGSNGYQPINSKNLSADIYAEGEASIKFGPKLSLGINVLGNGLTASLYAEAGVEVKGTATYNQTPEWTTDDNRHMCTLCAKIEVDRFIGTGFECKASLLGILKWEKNITFAEWRAHLGEFHASIISPADSPYGGRFRFGFGECQNNEYRDGVGKLSGNVKDAVVNQTISNVSITAFSGITQVASTASDYRGNYELNLSPGRYVVKIRATNYKPFDVSVTIESGRINYLETLLMIVGGSGNGTASGTIKNATDAVSISDATLKVRIGWGNTQDDEIIKTVTTDSNGKYEITLPYGHYTITASKDGFITGSFNIITGREHFERNFSLSPISEIDGENYKIVLEWGMYPYDLDSHIVASDTHVYYSNMSAPFVWLDIDDIDSYGPETITIENLAALGEFTFYVHDYSNRYDSYEALSLANSGATIRVYKGNQLLRTYNVPTNRDGTVWSVFSMGADGQITDINSFAYESNSSNVGRSSMFEAFSFMHIPLKDYELAA